MSSTTNTIVCTIIAKNYLAHARCLMASLAGHHPEWQRVVILADEPDGFFDPAAENFEILPSGTLAVPALRWLRFQYDVLEFSTALKPFALEQLLERPGVTQVIYLDPDILVYQRLKPVLDALDQNEVVLTPHLTDPSAFDEIEHRVLRCGAYNLGFIALRKGETSARLLRWWQSHMHEHCVVGWERGLFVDQHWMDLVPGMFPSVTVLRAPGCNVAPWNLSEREIVRHNGLHRVQGEPLYFVHFSGIGPGDSETVSRHHPHLKAEDLRSEAQMFHLYRQALRAAGWDECHEWPYTWGYFSNGVPIPAMGRQLIRESWRPTINSPEVDDPFSEQGFAHIAAYWNETAPVSEREGKAARHQTPIASRLLAHIHQTRQDVREVFPDPGGADRLSFLQWVLSFGRQELGLHERFLAPAQAERIRLLQGGSVSQRIVSHGWLYAANTAIRLRARLARYQEIFRRRWNRAGYSPRT